MNHFALSFLSNSFLLRDGEIRGRRRKLCGVVNLNLLRSPPRLTWVLCCAGFVIRVVGILIFNFFFIRTRDGNSKALLFGAEGGGC